MSNIRCALILFTVLTSCPQPNQDPLLDRDPPVENSCFKKTFSQMSNVTDLCELADLFSATLPFGGHEHKFVLEL